MEKKNRRRRGFLVDTTKPLVIHVRCEWESRERKPPKVMKVVKVTEGV